MDKNPFVPMKTSLLRIHQLDIQGPITRARARQLNFEVSSFLRTPLYNFENMMLPNGYIAIRSHGKKNEKLREESSYLSCGR